ncbi:RagB/SusD family nutrient uptake outer membrane protein [Compostibacter hankyongensis]|uniref:RagB/SusD family nutrient uptake outer membrane protein n=1 Tax=Compostibacter hankyongensis TaxID=1007089 RepID=A0ABP8FUH1_9BACT
MRNLSALTIGLILTAMVCSCNKMLDVPSKRAVSEENMWQNKNDALAATAGCYAMMRAALLNENAYWVYGELRAGDFTVTSREDLRDVTENNLQSSYPAMGQWRDWRRFYAAIAQCNLAIARLPEVPERDYRYSVNAMELDLAQVRYIRAFLYYYITRVWGDVPLITEPSDGTFQPKAREDRKKVLDFAAREALDCADGLPWKYDGTFPEAPGDYRGQGVSHHASIFITKGMAYTLAAHIYAENGEYDKALLYINQVINNQSLTGYGFVSTSDLSRLDGTFRGRGFSNIFQVDMNFDHAEISTTGQLEDWTLREPDIPKTQSEIYVSKDSILAIYNEPFDERPSFFFTQMETVDPVFYKVKQLNAEVKNPTLRRYSSAIVIFRYEELYLLRAECFARLGQNGDAIGALNDMRGRRKLHAVDGSLSGDALLDAILQERRRELIGEGWRWFDLVHFGKVPQFSTLSETDVQNGAGYWPISQEALTQNKLLVQSNYWK